MEYRTQKLRDLNRELVRHGGIEGYYHYCLGNEFTRQEIAENLGMSVSALAAWITKWNKAKEKPE